MSTHDDLDFRVEGIDEGEYNSEQNDANDDEIDFDVDQKSENNSHNEENSTYHDEDGEGSNDEAAADEPSANANAKPQRPAWEPYNFDRWLEKRLKQLKGNPRVKEERKRLEMKYRKAIEEQEQRRKEDARLAAQEKKERDLASSHFHREKKDSLVATLLVEKKEKELKEQANRNWREAQAAFTAARAAQKEQERARAQQQRIAITKSTLVNREKARREEEKIREREREYAREQRDERAKEERMKVRRQWVEEVRKRNKKRGLPLNTGIPQADLDELDAAKNKKKEKKEEEEESPEDSSFYHHDDNDVDNNDNDQEEDGEEQDEDASVDRNSPSHTDPASPLPQSPTDPKPVSPRPAASPTPRADADTQRQDAATQPTAATQRPPAPTQRPYLHFYQAATVPASVASKLAVEVASLAGTVFGPLHAWHELCVKHLVEACACACGEIAAMIDAELSTGMTTGMTTSGVSIEGGILRTANVYAGGLRGMWGDVRLAAEYEYGHPGNSFSGSGKTDAVMSNTTVGSTTDKSQSNGIGKNSDPENPPGIRNKIPSRSRVPSSPGARTSMRSIASPVTATTAPDASSPPATNDGTKTTDSRKTAAGNPSQSGSSSAPAVLSPSARAQLLEASLAVIFRAYEQERTRIYAAEQAYRRTVQLQRKRQLNEQALKEHMELQERENRMRLALFGDTRKGKSEKDGEIPEMDNTETTGTENGKNSDSKSPISPSNGSSLPVLSPYRGATVNVGKNTQTQAKPTNSGLNDARPSRRGGELPPILNSDPKSCVNGATSGRFAGGRASEVKKEDDEGELDGIVEWQARACEEARRLAEYWSLMGPWDFHLPGNV